MRTISTSLLTNITAAPTVLTNHSTPFARSPGSLESAPTVIRHFYFKMLSTLCVSHNSTPKLHPLYFAPICVLLSSSSYIFSPPLHCLHLVPSVISSMTPPFPNLAQPHQPPVLPCSPSLFPSCCQLCTAKTAGYQTIILNHWFQIGDFFYVRSMIHLAPSLPPPPSP